MAKFSNSVINLRSPLKTADRPSTTNFEDAPSYAPTLETELFLMAATYMAGEHTFYESAEEREARFGDLVAQVVATNPGFVARLAPYLRNELKIRSASIMLAAEYVAAGGEGGRSVINSVLRRGDEPAEMIGYWFSRHGRNMKMAVKRGVADAAIRLYTERSALRYDGNSRGIRMGDVLELTHPKPQDAKQSALFKWLLDRRHRGTTTADAAVLPMLFACDALNQVPNDQRRAMLSERGPEALAEAGMSWERLSGWLPGGMDAQAWESIIPSMGTMALIRNLRNFDRQGISDEAVETVLSRITDPKEVERARLFPYQVWAAYTNTASDNYQRALGTTLALTAQNVPALTRTLVLVDTSGSMNMYVSNRSTMSRVDVAAVMAAITAERCSQSDVVIFGRTNKRVDLAKGASVLQNVEHMKSLLGSVGHATYGHTAIADHYDPARHDRVVMFTDDQQHDAQRVDISHVPMIYTVDLAGYKPRSTKAGERGRHTLAGFSDATFSIMKTIETQRDANWPF